jgi:hypothetical protein
VSDARHDLAALEAARLYKPNAEHEPRAIASRAPCSCSASKYRPLRAACYKVGTPQCRSFCRNYRAGWTYPCSKVTTPTEKAEGRGRSDSE